MHLARCTKYNASMTKRSFDDLVALMTRLRGPGGCPWDREQTYETLKPFVIEEAYEVVDAIDRADERGLVEEIGDLLAEAVFLAEIAREKGVFEIGDAITAIHDKLVRRHPHVFADVKADTADAVVMNWERLKSAERKEENKSLMSGVPISLPALLKASRMTEKASRVGFDWERADDVVIKLEEEMVEFKEAMAAGNQAATAEELGDLLFTMANVARKLGLNPEEALQGANRKFQRRFESMEQSLRSSSRSFEELTLAEMDGMWEQAKREV